MVHLKYIDNPFNEKIMMIISNFYEEKSFYDCINRKFLDDEAFKNLEYTFSFYFLTGDSNDNIGYVLFYNKDLVDSYLDFACEETLSLLEKFKFIFTDISNQDEFKDLERIISQNNTDDNYRLIVENINIYLKKFSILKFINYIKFELDDQINRDEVSILEDFISKSYDLYDCGIIFDKLFSLFNNSNISCFQSIYDMFLDYWKKLGDYLENLPKYFYLNVVIALPIEDEIRFYSDSMNSNLNINQLAELKYYGFIREALMRVEDEINQKFSDIPIFLENGSDFSINDSSIKSYIKKIYK